jgi:hypothetical protein
MLDETMEIASGETSSEPDVGDKKVELSTNSGKANGKTDEVRGCCERRR